MHARAWILEDRLHSLCSRGHDLCARGMVDDDDAPTLEPLLLERRRGCSGTRKAWPLVVEAITNGFVAERKDLRAYAPVRADDAVDSWRRTRDRTDGRIDLRSPDRGPMPIVPKRVDVGDRSAHLRHQQRC